MSIRSLANKGSALVFSNKCSRHSKKASNYTNRAISSLRSAKSKKDINQKLDYIIEGMSNLSYAVKEVSDSVTPVARMNMVSALLSENIGELLNAQTEEIRGGSRR